MTIHTFGTVLPLFGASAPLLTAAVAQPYPCTLTKLARDAGISKFAASRAAAQLTDTGLLTSDPDGYQLNDNHPMAPLIIQLTWRFSGVVRATPPRQDVPYEVRLNRRRGGLDPHYQAFVPGSLHADAPDIPELEDSASPNLVTARETCDWLGERVVQLGSFEEDNRDVYDLWGTERLRNMVHQTQHFGGAAAMAQHTLDAACSPKAQGDHDPYTVGVRASAWVRATYLLSAEVKDVLRVVDLLDQSVWFGRRVNNLLSDAVYHLREVNHAGQRSEYATRWLDDALEAEREANELWADPNYEKCKMMPGTPRVEDVGTAGDQVMAVQLLRVAEEIAAQVAVMARAQCVQDWNALHNEEATHHLLVTEMPTDALGGARD